MRGSLAPAAMILFQLSLPQVLLVAANMDCSEEVLTIVSMLSTNNYIFMRPKKQMREADKKKAKFNDYKVLLIPKAK